MWISIFLCLLLISLLGAEGCRSSDDCGEAEACFKNLCQDPCLNFCPVNNSCKVRKHIASCHSDNNNYTRKGLEQKQSHLEISESDPSNNQASHWIPYYYKVMFPFSIQGEQFFYGQDQNYGVWFIQKLLPDGTMGPETDHGKWTYFYSVQFPFTIENRTFFYGQMDTWILYNSWFIQELLPGGKMGEQTDSGEWKNFYVQSFPFYMGGRVFFYGYTASYSNFWFIQELLPGGKMGNQTSSGNWDGVDKYQSMIPSVALT